MNKETDKKIMITFFKKKKEILKHVKHSHEKINKTYNNMKEFIEDFDNIKNNFNDYESTIKELSRNCKKCCELCGLFCCLKK